MPECPLNEARLDPRATTLVCMTTCSRPELVGTNLPALIASAREAGDSDVLLAIDGIAEHGNPETLDLALGLGVPCVTSDRAEGVGVSKNRVLSLLGGYSYYFFIDDDTEVQSSRAITTHIALHEETGIHHFSLQNPERLLEELNPTTTDSGFVIRHAKFGGGAFNFFTRTALATVGGWHSSFARLRRGGHTEHSYRVFRAGLCPSPFNVVEELMATCRWTDPPSVVSIGQLKQPIAGNHLFELENDLIAQSLTWEPFEAESPGRLVGK